MPRALIADDEVHLAHYLRDQLARLWPELEIVAVARNGLEAAAQIAELQPDIAFLDIQMPGLTGLEVAGGIEGLTRVVFVTAYDEYALTAFDAEALDYVLKPVTAERLARTVERLHRALAPRDDARITDVDAAGIAADGAARASAGAPASRPFATQAAAPPVTTARASNSRGWRRMRAAAARSGPPDGDFAGRPSSTAAAGARPNTDARPPGDPSIARSSVWIVRV